jgi:predicted KAP-like P-loop ATPase
MTKENPKLRLELNPNRLAEIIGSAVFASTQVVNLHFNALSEENLNRPIEGSGVLYRFKGPELNLDQRRAMHENWILGKAFQELLRSVRHALEEAHVMTALLTREHKIRSNETLANSLRPFQAKAAGLSFPKLLADVNKLLDPKLDFSDSYDSLQVARNCLEHRAGIVSNIETKGGAEFILNVPRVKIFYMRGPDEIELAAGERVDAGDGRPEVEILMRFEARQRSIPIGGRITFSLIEFNEVSFACNFMGQQLATRLPKQRLSVSEDKIAL